MRLLSGLRLLPLAALALASVIPINGTQTAVKSYDDWILGFPEFLRIHHEASLSSLYEATHVQQTSVQQTSEPHTDGVVRRAQMFRGMTYRVAGWVFSISYYLVDEWGGTTWQFPPNDNQGSRSFIANHFAADVGTIGRDVVYERVLAGGWSWSGHAGTAYMFTEIPYDALFNTAFDAMEGAVDWLSGDNGVTWQMLDTVGREIAAFTIFPTNARVDLAPRGSHEF